MNLPTKPDPLLKTAALAAGLSASALRLAAADASPSAASPASAIPSWLQTLSVTGREYYDANVLVVSGQGMPVESSWVSEAGFEAAANLAPLIHSGPTLSTLLLDYQLDWQNFAQASSENFSSHKLTEVLAGNDGNISYSLNNAFLYVDGNKLAETYALNQITGTGANQGDKYRNNYTHAVARERRNQDQDRYAALVRWDAPDQLWFVRGVSSLTWYDLNTDIFNTSKAPYLGYQDYVDRWDINGGADLGVNVTKTFALIVGWRDGYQHQDQWKVTTNSDTHFSSNHYQRLLFGFEGSPVEGLTLKFTGGPDFRDFNPDAPMVHDRTTRFYGEGTATETLSKTQNLSFSYKQWIFVSSTGIVPYTDTIATLAYHLALSPQWGFDASAKYLEANYTLASDLAGSAPSLRDDLDYQGSLGFSYLVVPHFTVAVNYVYDKGLNGLKTLPAKYFPAYRDFEHPVSGITLKYAF